mmetsp:Transcript_10544/g.25754  ORF Transcript_10544/g.25754 Transcript_10544/m.25754 type:complete len:148 (-) Transcript_10544:260-703(-)
MRQVIFSPRKAAGHLLKTQRWECFQPSSSPSQQLELTMMELCQHLSLLLLTVLLAFGNQWASCRRILIHFGILNPSKSENSSSNDNLTSKHITDGEHIKSIHESPVKIWRSSYSLNSIFVGKSYNSPIKARMSVIPVLWDASVGFVT